jgi:hypothetical protein
LAKGQVAAKEALVQKCQLSANLLFAPVQKFRPFFHNRVRTKNLLQVSFLEAEERRGCWEMLQDEAIRRAIETCEPDDLTIESDDEEDRNLLQQDRDHQRQAHGHPIFNGLEDFTVHSAFAIPNDAVQTAAERKTAEVKDEVARLQRQPSLPFDASPLIWWKERAIDHKYLAPFACATLAMPDSSAPSERVFSIAGLTLTSNRGRLDSYIVEDIVLLKDSKPRVL